MLPKLSPRGRSGLVALGFLAILIGGLAAGPAAAPDPRYSALVRAWYRDLFGRTPSEAEIMLWQPVLAASPPRSVAMTLIVSPEGQSVAFTRIATSAMGDPLVNWRKLFLDQIATRREIRQMARLAVVCAPEYRKHTGMSWEAWLKGLHRVILRRDPTPVEAAGWKMVLDANYAGDHVAYYLSKSHEGAVAAVRGLFLDLLGHEPRPDLLDVSVARILNGATEEDVLADLLASDEYALQRGVPRAPVDAPARSH